MVSWPVGIEQILAKRSKNMTIDIVPKKLSDLDSLEEKFKNYVESHQELTTYFPKGYPDVNAKVLMEKRLFERKRWSEISLEFNNIPVKTLINFWNNQILPLLTEIYQNLV